MTAFIDVHHHLLPDFYIEAVGVGPITSQAPRFSRAALEWTPQKSIDEMDRNGVAGAILSVSAPGVGLQNPTATSKLARRCNDYMATKIAQCPGRFGMFAALPLPDVQACLDEIHYAGGQLNTDGYGMLSCYGNDHLGSSKFDPVFDELNRREAIVFIHPTVSDACRQLMPEFPASTLEFPLDTTRTAMSLLFNGVFARYPNIRFIFSHAGGAVPYLSHRMVRLEALDEFAAQTPSGAMHLLQRQYFDCALSATPPALAALTQFVPATQVLFGSDFPFAPGMVARTIAGLAAFDLGRDAADLIERGNALKLFPRFSNK